MPQTSSLIPPSSQLDADLAQWLAIHADDLNRNDAVSEEVVPRLARAGLFSIGVPEAQGGAGGDVRDATQAVADVAEYSMAAAFAFWGQRSFIQYLLQSPNRALAERHLPSLLAGERAGASGLSNAMKFLGGIESLQVTAQARANGWRLHGKLPWVTNLRRAGFVAAAAVATTAERAPMVIAFDSALPGVERSDDLDLIALRGSNTAAIALENVAIDAADVLHEDAGRYLPQVRPAFLSLQCGMSIGLSRASLRQALIRSESRRGALVDTICALQQELQTTVAQLLDGVANDHFQTQAAPLFRLRIRLAEIAQQAVGLELQAKGGSAYLAPDNNDFLRRWTEAAFVPVVTPSLTQLQAELQRHHVTRA
ncbi:acyl-CoA dehydrogenase family protein [Herbaspirillum sp. NPDC087042]|uniref:acyl-CoA dehydrogenase family protein n=1 Tax=Herbaspirillum sp. NPDC087042 TaxID=3364004 RepID=UPI00381E562B